MHKPVLIGLLSAVGLGLSCLTISTRPGLLAQQSSPVLPAQVVGGAFGGAGNPANEASPAIKLAAKPMTVAETKVWLKLQEKVTFDFPKDATLDEVIKHVQKSTVDKTDFPDGIPIYVDPQGLQDADKTMASTVQICLKGIPLTTTLKLTLRQLGLGYWVNHDGLLIITYIEADEMPVDPSPLILEELAALRREVRELHNELRTARGAEPLKNPGPGEPKTTPAMGAFGGFR